MTINLCLVRGLSLLSGSYKHVHNNTEFEPVVESHPIQGGRSTLLHEILASR